MSKLADSRTARFQNISTLNTSVLKNGKSVGLKPAGIVELSGKDVQETKDASMDPERNPFDTGLVAQIPAGARVHPDAPKLAKGIRADKAATVVADGTMKDIRAMVEGIADNGGISVMNRVLEDLKDKIPEKRHADIEQLVEDQSSRIDTMNRRNREKYEGALL